MDTAAAAGGGEGCKAARGRGTPAEGEGEAAEESRRTSSKVPLSSTVKCGKLLLWSNFCGNHEN